MYMGIDYSQEDPPLAPTRRSGATWEYPATIVFDLTAHKFLI